MVTSSKIATPPFAMNIRAKPFTATDAGRLAYMPGRVDVLVTAGSAP